MGDISYNLRGELVSIKDLVSRIEHALLEL